MIELSHKPKQPHRNRKIVHLMKQIHMIFPQVDFTNIDTQKLGKYLTELMSRNAFQGDLYDLVVSKTLLSVLEQITHKIFVEWWRPPLALPYLMSALDDVAGLSVLELQGRIKGNKLVWFKVYGAKGAEEREKVQMWKVGQSS
jgi:hypothetical protein